MWCVYLDVSTFLISFPPRQEHTQQILSFRFSFLRHIFGLIYDNMCPLIYLHQDLSIGGAHTRPRAFLITTKNSLSPRLVLFGEKGRLIFFLRQWAILLSKLCSALFYVSNDEIPYSLIVTDEG